MGFVMMVVSNVTELVSSPLAMTESRDVAEVPINSMEATFRVVERTVL